MTEALHPEEVITSFLLIRHGHTVATEEGRLYTDPNAPLTERGLQQARSIAEWIERQPPDVLLTSPAVRVRSTADIVAEKLKTEATVVPGLDEWHIGEWEGRTYLDIKKNDPELYKAWSSDPIHNAPPGGESISDVCNRMQKHLSAMLSQYEGKTIALVTHAGIVRSILVNALEMKVENFWRIAIPTGSVSRVDFSSSFATVHYFGFRPGM